MSNVRAIQTSTRLLLNPSIKATGHQPCSRSYAREATKLSELEIRYYSDVLGTPYNASEGRLKQAFYTKSKQTHPDINKEDPDAKNKFEKITEAYHKLIGHHKVIREYTDRLPYRPSRAARNIRSWVQPKAKRTPDNAGPQQSSQASGSTSTTDANVSTEKPTVKNTASSDFLDKKYIHMLKRDSKLHADRKKKVNQPKKEEEIRDCVIQ